jgi:hypothetical protein
MGDSLFICAYDESLSYEMSYESDIFLDIRVFGADNAWRTPPADPPCMLQYARPYADILLTRSDLSRIKQIRFYTLYELDKYDVRLEGQYIALRPSGPERRIVKPLPDRRKADPLGRFMLPRETIALFVPGSVSTPDAKEAVRQLAMERGLTPVEEVVNNFTPGLRQDGVWFFVDETGEIFGSLQEEPDSRPEKIGHIPYTRQVRDVSGLRNKTGYLDVYARLKDPYE